MTAQAKMVTGMYLLYNGTVYGELLGEVNEPPFTVEKVTSTTHDDGGHASKVPGESDDGDLKFSVNFVNDTAQAALRALARAKTVGTWTLVYPKSFGNLGYSIPGFVSNLVKKLPMKSSPATWEVTITPSFKVTELTTAAANLTTPFLSVVGDNGAEDALTLSPSAAAAVYEYDCTSYSDQTHLHITPTATTGTIYVDGVVTASGAASAAISHSLTAYTTGKIQTIFVVVIENNKIPSVYKIRVTRGSQAAP